MKKLKTVTPAFCVIVSLSLLVGCSSDPAMKQFKESEMPPEVEETVKPTNTPIPEPTDGILEGTDGYGDYGYEEIPDVPTDEELDALIKQIEEEQGIKLGDSLPDPTPSSDPTPTPTPSTNPNNGYERDNLPSDIAQSQGKETPPPQETQSQSDADMQRIRDLLGSGPVDTGEHQVTTGTAQMSPEEKAQLDKDLADMGVGWE